MSFTTQQLAEAILNKLSERSQIDVRGDGEGAVASLADMLEKYRSKVLIEAAASIPAVNQCIPTDPSEAPSQGDRVRVVRGRKVPIGTEGELFWMKEQVYQGRTVMRIGVKDDAGVPHWTYLRNVEKVAA